MKILVCVKQVPDLEAMTTDMPSAGWPRADVNGRMNRYDEYALEAALQLREAGMAKHITALTVGAAADQAVLRRAIGMGADHGVHIRSDLPPIPSPFNIGGLIAAYGRNSGYALILCGAMSEDLMQGMVGPVIAGLLDWPCLTAVHALRVGANGRELLCEREIEGGRQQALALDLPGVVSIQSGRQVPRYPSLSNLLKANAYQLETLPADSLRAVDARQHSEDMGLPSTTRRGLILEGVAGDKAQALADWLREQGVC
jgi:electron transfer flavoprotein beta subunit